MSPSTVNCTSPPPRRIANDPGTGATHLSATTASPARPSPLPTTSAPRGASPLSTQTSPVMACNADPRAPALIAPARAGSTVRFLWSSWFASHKGPIVNYLARYTGPVEKVDLNALSWFKISERGLAADGRWAVDEMMDDGNVTATVTPHDIAPVTYILRHELIALHYMTEDSL
ncbi:hypothetical protein EJ06DRAFT_530892 [Trichodelitschia bisporula]|uniref:lytic cellulose monooxygenase (C4-dehydrogenating) n=1 Tax=Trichodelitschia bisporula TaxID=703511 RepID=A0A6G1HVU1_9PEZI|nr:hypothetical protein EJ06DRAFT_530892 [Trichodelitschia bisporula]